MSLTSLELAGSFFTFTLYLYSLFFTAQPWKSKVRIITKIESSINMKVKVSQLCPTLCNPTGYTVHGILHSRILEWVAFPFSKGSNPGLLHCRWILNQLSHKESPRILEWVFYPFSSVSSIPSNQTRASCIPGGFFTNYLT